MGRWIEALDKEGKVIRGKPAGVLIHASRFFPKKLKDKTPLLVGLQLWSDKWEGELQVFRTDRIETLRNELVLVQNIINMEVFIDEVNADEILKYWKGEGFGEQELKQELNELLLFLEESINQNLLVHVEI